MTLRCTRKLLKTLRAPVAAEPTYASTVLGDWYANLYETRPHRLVLCLSDRPRLLCRTNSITWTPSAFAVTRTT